MEICCMCFACFILPFHLANALQPKAMEVITGMQLRCNQLQHVFLLHPLVFDHTPPLHPHCTHSVLLLLLLCQPSTVLWLICRHMLIVNISSLQLQWIPTWCFGSGWTCSINIIHLTGMDRDYFKVKQPGYLLNELALIRQLSDIKTRSIRRSNNDRLCYYDPHCHILSRKRVDISVSGGTQKSLDEGCWYLGGKSKAHTHTQSFFASTGSLPFHCAFPVTHGAAGAGGQGSRRSFH